MNFCRVKSSPQTRDVYKIIDSLSKNNSPVLFLGEKGCGKEAFARHLSRLQYGDIAFIKINCKTSVSERFNMDFKKEAVYFFDDVGFLNIELQQLVLNILKNFQLSFDNNKRIRFLFSSSQNLAGKTGNSEFLSELYDRLKYVSVKIPPLRERREDIIYLVQSFCKEFNIEYEKNITGISMKAKKLLEEYSWPLNIDQLISVISLAVMNCEGSVISCNNLAIGLNNNLNYDIIKSGLGTSRSLKDAVDDFKKDYLISVLDSVNWNQTVAAKVLDIQRTYLSKLMGELKIQK